MQTLRLNRYLAQLGIASRRKADEMIVEGRVSVDGKTVDELGFKVLPGKSKIAVDGEPVRRTTEKLSYYLLFKPKNVVTTMSDPEQRPTVAEYIGKIRERIYPVGRLDYDAEGALLLTNDGDLANQLMHPKFGTKKTYLVKVKGKPSAEKIAKLRRGVRLEDGFAKPLELSYEESTKMNTWFRMSVVEGRNHLVKRMWLRVDHPVISLVRSSFAGLTLHNMRPGQIRPLTPAEIKRLKSLGKE